MNRMTICAAITFVGAFFVSTRANADISGPYDWVAYNSLTAFIGSALPPAHGDYDSSYVPAGNVTDFTWDGDRGGDATATSGELLDYVTGTGTGVNMQVFWNGEGQLFIEKGYENIAPAASEFDILGPNYKGKVVLHGGNGDQEPSGTQTIVFTGLDPTMSYEFYGIAEANSSYYDSFAQIDLLSVDASTNESTITTNASIHAVSGWTGINTPTQSWLSNVNDDLIKFTDIQPGADGTFAVVASAGYHGSRAHAPAFDAIALTKVSEGGGPVDPPGGSPIPEPTSQAMALVASLGLLACALYRWRRRRIAHW